MTAYQFRKGFRHPGSITAEQVKAELDRIRTAKNELTARAIVEESRAKDAVLHEFFEWDDAKAAEAHRLQQASYVARSVEVVYAESEMPYVAFTLAKPEDGPQQYYPTQVVVQTPDLYADGLRRLRADMVGAINSVRQLEQLADSEPKRRKIAKVGNALQRAADGLARI